MLADYASEIVLISKPGKATPGQISGLNQSSPNVCSNDDCLSLGFGSFLRSLHQEGLSFVLESRGDFSGRFTEDSVETICSKIQCLSISTFGLRKNDPTDAISHLSKGRLNSVGDFFASFPVVRSPRTESLMALDDLGAAICALAYGLAGVRAEVRGTLVGIVGYCSVEGSRIR
ncbi:hypothetical protein ABW19_dt0200060 [Dactylella cylindrospora]|nr:hypothetical protein ABW19_dt0200060 [Dactylella cylindrospora]